MDTWRHGHMMTWTHGYMDTWWHRHMDTCKHGQRHGHVETCTWRHQTETGTEAQAIFLNLFTICLSYRRKFVVCPLLTKKQTEFIRLQMDLTDLPIYGFHSVFFFSSSEKNSCGWLFSNRIWDLYWMRKLNLTANEKASSILLCQRSLATHCPIQYSTKILPTPRWDNLHHGNPPAQNSRHFYVTDTVWRKAVFL